LEDQHGSLLGSPAGVEERLIKDFTEDKFYTCTIEVLLLCLIFTTFLTRAFQVLHIVYDGKGSSHLFVTDYTRHKYSCRLPDQATSISAGNFHDGVLKISLQDRQAEMVKKIDVGSFYRIQKLRLKKSTARNEYLGLLGGNERLISKLKEKNSDHVPLKDLLS
jgi:hypothetical protein